MRLGYLMGRGSRRFCFLGGRDARDDVALDELLLAPSGLAQGERRESVEIAVRTVGTLVQHRDCVGGEDFLLAADELESLTDVLGRVVGRQLADGDVAGESRGETA